MTQLRKALRDTRKLRKELALQTVVELHRVARLNCQARYIETLIAREVSQ